MTGISTLCIRVVELDDLVEPLRRKYTPSGKKGMPTHITALHPFKDIDDLSPDIMTKLKNTILSVPRFEYTITDIGMFGDTVLYLNPTPAEPFVRMIKALVQAFPENLPYGGAFGDAVIPHCTVAHVSDERPGMRLIEYLEDHMHRIQSMKLKAHQVWLYRKPTGKKWEMVESMDLGAYQTKGRLNRPGFPGDCFM